MSKTVQPRAAKAPGKPFAPGQSGNPAGRPKGSKSRPKELTPEQESDALCERGTEHVKFGRLAEARIAFAKALALAGISAERIEREKLVDDLIGVAQKSRRRDIIESLFADADAAYLKHVGLPAGATLDQFKALYAVGSDDFDSDRALADLERFPPIANRIAELKAEQARNSAKTARGRQSEK